jgi:acetylornithine deacetylase
MAMQRDLDRAIESHTEDTFAFLERLVAAPSVVGAEQGALDVFAGALTDLDFEVEVLPFPTEQIDDPRAGIQQRVDHPEGRYQVVGRTPGSGDLALLLNGHIDVVPAESPEQWTTPPFAPSRRDGRMYGRGTADMKGGFALGVLALTALKDVAPRLFASKRLGFVAVIEEECTGNGALHSALNGVIADEVLLLEPTDLGIMLGGVGVLWLDIEVLAAAGHAQEAHRSANAVDLGMRLVAAIRDWCAELTAREPDPELGIGDGAYNLNLGTVAAGDWRSTVPASATFGVRVGYPRSWSPDRAEAEVRAFIRSAVQSDPDFTAQPVVTASGFRASGYWQDPQHALVADLRAAHLDAHGVEPATFSLGSTTDARTYINGFGVPAVCFGATAHNMHGIDESVELQSIVDGARTLGRFLLSRFGDAG